MTEGGRWTLQMYVWCVEDRSFKWFFVWSNSLFVYYPTEKFKVPMRPLITYLHVCQPYGICYVGSRSSNETRRHQRHSNCRFQEEVGGYAHKLQALCPTPFQNSRVCGLFKAKPTELLHFHGKQPINGASIKSHSSHCQPMGSCPLWVSDLPH